MTNPAENTETLQEIERLRDRLAKAESKLAEAQEVIRAIQSGDVDAVVVSGPEGEQVFTLRGAEYAYRVLVEAMNEGAATINAGGMILYCNQRLSDLLNLPIERVIGSPASQFFSQGEIRFEDLFTRALNGEAVRGELQICCPEVKVPILLSLRKTKDQGLATVCMVVTDVTESKQWEELVVADKALRENEAQLRERVAELTTILEVTPAVMFIARDPECKEMISSKLGYDFLRFPNGFNSFPSAQSKQRPAGFRVFEDGHEITPQEFPVQRAAGSGIAVKDHELTIIFDDGTRKEIFGSAVPLFNELGQSRGAIGVFIDVTERNRIEAALRQNEKLAAVGKLAASIAHEINNPLAAVTNLLFLILSGTSLGQVRGFAKTAEQEMERVSSMVAQTLRFYRQTSRPVEVSLSEVLDLVLAINQPRFSHANVKVTRQYRSDAKLLAYDGELRHLFANLVGNAFDAIRSGGQILVRISDATHPRNSERGLRVTIADNGHGIDHSAVGQIFQPFFSTKGDMGTGLGLWIVQSITTKHGGTIRVRSKTLSPSWTVFSVFLPFDFIRREGHGPEQALAIGEFGTRLG